jgi:hypothetical protein
LRAATAFSAAEASAGLLTAVPGESAVVPGTFAPLVVDQATPISARITAVEYAVLVMIFSKWPKVALPILDQLSGDEFRVAPPRALDITFNGGAYSGDAAASRAFRAKETLSW